jgi:hypothetical protein
VDRHFPTNITFLNATTNNERLSIMTSFRMQERDLDLFILEELHSDNGFDGWFGERIGLKGFRCRGAEHSVSAKSNAKWGETDVLALYSDNVDTVAVLIEDKIAADFTELQAKRYHERGADIVRSGTAQRYLTVLVAPSVYTAGVPKDDPWDKTLNMKELRDWFTKDSTAHAGWRTSALSECLVRVAKSKSVGNAEVRRFSEAFASFLQQQTNLPFSHKITGDKWGFIINAPDIPQNVQLAWKNGKSRVDLTFSGPHVGKAHRVPALPGISRRLADGVSLKSDIFGVEVPMVDMSADFEGQMEVITEVMAAARQLLPLVPQVLGAPHDLRSAVDSY